MLIWIMRGSDADERMCLAGVVMIDTYSCV